MANVIDVKLRSIVEVLSAGFQPKKIYLFGSRARQESGPNSDYDLVVVLENSDLTFLERMQKAQRLLFLAEIWTPADVFVYTESEFEEKKDDFQSIPQSVVEEGLEMPLA